MTDGIERIDPGRPDVAAVVQQVHDFAEAMAGPDTRVCDGAPTHPSMNQLRALVAGGMALYVRWEAGAVAGFVSFSSDGLHFLWGREAVEAAGYGAEYDARVADFLAAARRELGVWVEDVAGVPADEFFPGAMPLARRIVGG